MSQPRAGSARGIPAHWVLAIAILAASTVPLCLLGGLQILTMDRLSNEIDSQNEKGANALAGLAESALRKQGKAGITQVLSDKASSVDTFFRDVERLVLLERSFAERAWKCPHPAEPGGLLLAQDMRAPQKRPADAREDPVRGCVVSHASPMVHRPVGVEPAVEAEVWRPFGHMAFELKSLLDQNTKLLFTYLGTREGMFLTYPADASLQPDYDPRTRDWYKAAAAAGGPIWTPPYEDAGTKVLVITCAAPVTIDGELAAVVAVDLRLDAFVKDVLAIRAHPKWTSALIDSSGGLVAAPSLRGIDSSDPASPGRIFDAEQIRDLLEGEETVVELDSGGESYLAGARRISAVGWSLVVAVPSEVLLGPSREVRDKARQIAGNLGESVRGSRTAALEWLFGVALLLVVLSIVIAVAMGHALSRPLELLATTADQLAEGNFEARAPVRGPRETRTLASSFNRMIAELAEYTKRVVREAAEKQRIATELRTAHDIQQSLIPETFPQMPGAAVHAAWHPARETAGDFYDMFHMPDGRLGFVVADVSGKGVGAAVFMTMTRAYLRTYARFESSPGGILTMLNETLASNRETGMFVTAICGTYDPSIGRVILSNAGHLPPLLALGGKCEERRLSTGLPLGFEPGQRYEDTVIDLSPGDMIFLYTDGVTEAFNPRDELYGSERLLEAFERGRALGAMGFCAFLSTEITRWAQDRNQSDDVCLLALERNEPSGPGSPGALPSSSPACRRS